MARHFTFDFLFTPFQKILPKALANIGLSREAKAALICERYRKLAPRVVHEQALLHTMPKFFRGATLTVGVTNPAWAGRIATCKKDLLAALNESLGKKTVEDIKTKVVENIAC